MANLSVPNTLPSTVRVWDLPLRLFHWLLLAAVAVAFLSSEEGSPLAEWHMVSGWVVAVLIVFRMVWGIVGGEHARFTSFVRPSAVPAHVAELVGGRAEATLGHNPLGGLSAVLLLALVAAVVATGAWVAEATEELHEILAWALLVLIGIHVLAVLFMSVLTRENLVGAMITGNKPAARHAAARDARAPRATAIILAAVAMLATTYLILRYEPLAFQPRSPEAVEHAGGRGASIVQDNQDVEGSD